MVGAAAPVAGMPFRKVRDDDREALATLFLEAYRGTIDDEGEGPEEARAAVDYYLATILRPYSFVVETGDDLVAASLVVSVEGTHYIDPVVVSPSSQRRGVGRMAVIHSLAALAGGGISEVGAVITDGNTPSEGLFASLGFVRVGPWPASDAPV